MSNSSADTGQAASAVLEMLWASVCSVAGGWDWAEREL